MRILTVVSLAAAALTAPLAAQDSQLRVFLDCVDVFCDFDYIRTEVAFVAYVRDRDVADVHVLVTGQQAGSGGRELTLRFLGRGAFAGTADTLRVITLPTDTEDQQRAALARTLALGLVRFAARTATASRLRVVYDAPSEQGTAAAVRDPWHYWVFRARVGGNLNAEEQFSFLGIQGSLSADRVTEKWKIRISANENYNESNFDVPEFDSSGTQIGMNTLTSITRSHRLRSLVAKSMGPRWSAGARLELRSATFENRRLLTRLAPTVEFDVFPYAQATRRHFAWRYSLGFSDVSYNDTTIFGRVREQLVDQQVEITIAFKQPWGSLGAGVEASHYLHDFRKHRLEVSGFGEFRIHKGLTLNLYGGASLVRDLLNLPKGGATSEEILLRRRQLATGYEVFGGLQLSFTFGSIFSTIVNPRFEL